MDLKQLNDIQSKASTNNREADAYKSAADEIAHMRSITGIANMMKRFYDSLPSVFGKHKEHAQKLLIENMERAWPDICRQTELELQAKARTHSNAGRRLQAQVDAYFDPDEYVIEVGKGDTGKNTLVIKEAVDSTP